MNVIDSSGWLEYFADGPKAGFFADAIEDTEHLIVPVITIYEVFKQILQQRGEVPHLFGPTCVGRRLAETSAKKIAPAATG